MKPLTRYFGEWKENLYDSIDKGDYWYKESEIKDAVEWLKDKVKDKEIKVLISRAFPEMWFSKRRKRE